MIDNYKVVTLCGSIKFKDEFLRIQDKLVLEGNIVLTPYFFEYSGENIKWTPELKQQLDNIHKRKIDLCDEIYVINKNGYIGQSTKSEIDYAKLKMKKIVFLEPINE